MHSWALTGPLRFCSRFVPEEEGPFLALASHVDTLNVAVGFLRVRVHGDDDVLGHSGVATLEV